MRRAEKRLPVSLPELVLSELKLLSSENPHSPPGVSSARSSTLLSIVLGDLEGGCAIGRNLVAELLCCRARAEIVAKIVAEIVSANAARLWWTLAGSTRGICLG